MNDDHASEAELKAEIRWKLEMLRKLDVTPTRPLTAAERERLGGACERACEELMAEIERYRTKVVEAPIDVRTATPIELAAAITERLRTLEPVEMTPDPHYHYVAYFRLTPQSEREATRRRWERPAAAAIFQPGEWRKGSIQNRGLLNLRPFHTRPMTQAEVDEVTQAGRLLEVEFTDGLDLLTELDLLDEREARRLLAAMMRQPGLLPDDLVEQLRLAQGINPPGDEPTTTPRA